MPKNNTRILAVFTVIFTVLLIGNILATTILFTEVLALEQDVTKVETTHDDINEYLLQQNEFTTPRNNTSVNTAAMTSGDVFAHTAPGDAVAIPFTYHALPSNDLYINTAEANVGREFQTSVRTAQTAVERSAYTPRGDGGALTLDTPEQWKSFNGASAGLAFTAHIASTDPDYELRDDIAFTGSVTATGDVQRVQNIEAKTRAAKRNGYTVMITPYTKNSPDVNGVQIIQVESVSEALNYALTEQA
jgi:ATP-dependent Lon protease